MERRDLGEAGQARRLEAVIGQGGAVRADVVFNEHEAVHQTRALAGNVVQALAVLAPGRVLLIRRQLLHVTEQFELGFERRPVAGQRVGQVAPCHRRAPVTGSAAIVDHASRSGRIRRSTSSMPATSFLAVDSISRPVM